MDKHFPKAAYLAPFAFASVITPTVSISVGMIIAADRYFGGPPALIAACLAALFLGVGCAAISIWKREPMRKLAFAGIAAGLLPAGIFLLALGNFSLPN